MINYDDLHKKPDEEFRRLLWFLLGGTRGGENRAKILNAIKARPCNLNQLAKLLGVDYRSAQHHMSVLQKNNLVLSAGQRYGVVYSVHPYLEYHFEVFEEVCLELRYFPTAPDSNPIIRAAVDMGVKPITAGKSMSQTGLAGDGPHL
jgi:DNA-binding transcriptional ArsR family regulator